MTLEELKAATHDLNEKPHHTHAAIPIAAYVEQQALITRVMRVVKEMREQGEDTPKFACEISYEEVDKWADELEGNGPV